MGYFLMTTCLLVSRIGSAGFKPTLNYTMLIHELQMGYRKASSSALLLAAQRTHLCYASIVTLYIPLPAASCSNGTCVS